MPGRTRAANQWFKGYLQDCVAEARDDVGAWYEPEHFECIALIAGRTWTAVFGGFSMMRHLCGRR